VNPGLQAPLDVDRGGGRVNPAGGDQGECGEDPEGDESDPHPPKERQERGLAEDALRDGLGGIGHLLVSLLDRSLWTQRRLNRSVEI